MASFTIPRIHAVLLDVSRTCQRCQWPETRKGKKDERARERERERRVREREGERTERRTAVSFAGAAR